jgi:fumarate reductase subunit D
MGSFYLVKKEKNWPLIFLWLLATPSASALTFQSPQALRSASMAVPLAIISAYGFYQTIRFFSQNIIGRLLIIFLFAILIFNFLRFWHFYNIHNPKQIPIAFQPGFSELVPFIFGKKDNYQKVIVTDRYDQPYILFLFYSKYNPNEFALQAKLESRDQFGFSTVRAFDKFEFRKVNWEADSKLKNTIVVAAPEEVPKNVKIDKTIYFPNQKPVFLIIKND